MLKFLYQLGLYAYGAILRLASLFSSKARLWVAGRRGFFERFEADVASLGQAQRVWFHCASLGEFEQGRPLIEAFREQYPDHKIVLTFFSPSGYEIRKNYPHADLICYLPLDTPANAQRFVALLAPRLSFFVKYEFWYNYLAALHQANIPTVLFSAIFRENQVFFKPWGGLHRQMLGFFAQLFVQNQSSVQLLKGIGIDHAVLVGDTRFDRVAALAQTAPHFELIEAFKADSPLLLVGSAWPADVQVITQVYNTTSVGASQNLKLVIAPHEIKPEQIAEWQKLFRVTTLRYSEATMTNAPQAEVLFIDNIGMLAALYQYADFAWIGGAYGSGLHNTLEAATFGMPIFFGNKRYQKFQEALDLLELGAAEAIRDAAHLGQVLDKLLLSTHARQHRAAAARRYAQANVGATPKIMNWVREQLHP